ncbi:MAG: flagellar hook-associated protein FlgL [Gammaproteobacteria bacterium]|nr:flagellar hook-associated protein FlgL [Gammaproteobacteria bacterium]
MRISSNQLAMGMAAQMMQRQIDIAKSQEEVASGKRVNRPSDDPAVAGQLLGMQEARNTLDQYNRNAITAESRLGMEETAIAAAADTLMRLRDLALTANSGAVDNATRSAIGAELLQRTDELYDIANSRDANGDYLFSGSKSTSQPFHRQVPVQYSGSDDNNRLPIGLGREIQLGDSGSDVFQRIRNGNGTFTTSQAPTNTGSAIISAGEVTDLTAFTHSQYVVSFTSPTTFDITNSDTGAPVQTGVTYDSGNAIEFDGLSIDITGSANTGDEYVIRPSENQDIFSMVNDFSVAMSNSPVSVADKAKQQQSVNSILVNIDQALAHLNDKRSLVGARLNTIDAARDENNAVNLQLNRTVASIEDADITSTIIELQSNINSLETLQKSYSRVQNMSLFNFI